MLGNGSVDETREGERDVIGDDERPIWGGLHTLMTHHEVCAPAVQC